jgi:hypothetical protein
LAVLKDGLERTEANVGLVLWERAREELALTELGRAGAACERADSDYQVIHEFLVVGTRKPAQESLDDKVGGDIVLSWVEKHGEVIGQGEVVVENPGDHGQVSEPIGAVILESVDEHLEGGN